MVKYCLIVLTICITLALRVTEALAVYTNAQGAVISTIKPAGGGDYTTIQAWSDAVKSSTNPAQWAECYAGGDLGEAELFSWAEAPTTSRYPRIYVAPGQGHNGQNAAVGAYYKAKTYGANALAIYDVPYFRVEGLRCDITADYGVIGLWVGYNAIVVDGMLFRDISTGVVNEAVACGVEDSALTTQTVQNCVIYGGGQLMTGFDIFADWAAANLYVKVFNNYVYGTTTNYGIGGNGISFYENPGNTLTVLAVNNIAMNNQNVDFSIDGTIDLYMTNNVSSDTTAGDWGGSGNMTNKTAASLVVNPNGFAYPSVGSVLIDAGVTISSFSSDATHGSGWRPQGAVWDIGAFERLGVGKVDYEIQFVPPYNGRMVWY